MPVNTRTQGNLSTGNEEVTMSDQIKEIERVAREEALAEASPTTQEAAHQVALLKQQIKDA